MKTVKEIQETIKELKKQYKEVKKEYRQCKKQELYMNMNNCVDRQINITTTITVLKWVLGDE